MGTHNNPYSPNSKEVQELNEKKKKAASEIERIKKELEEQTQKFVEMQESHIGAYDKQISELKKQCTHRDAKGEFTISKKQKDRLVWDDDGILERCCFCGICGELFTQSRLEFDPNRLKDSDNIIYVIEDYNSDAFYTKAEKKAKEEEEVRQQEAMNGNDFQDELDRIGNNVAGIEDLVRRMGNQGLGITFDENGDISFGDDYGTGEVRRRGGMGYDRYGNDMFGIERLIRGR